QVDGIDRPNFQERLSAVLEGVVVIDDFDPITHCQTKAAVAPQMFERHDLALEFADGKDDGAVLARPFEGSCVRFGTIVLIPGAAAPMNLHAVELVLRAPIARVRLDRAWISRGLSDESASTQGGTAQFRHFCDLYRCRGGTGDRGL